MNTKKLAIIGVLGIAVISYFFISKKETYDIEVSAINKGDTIIAFGDSLTYGYGAKFEEAYPSQLENIIGYSVINEGKNGDTAKNGKVRLKQSVSDYSPKLVLLGLGGNDMLRKDDANLKADLKEMINYLKANNVQVAMLATPQPDLFRAMTGSLSDAELYKKIAKEEKILLLDNIYAKYLSDKDLRSDQIHLNKEGYRLVAQDIAERLKDAGLIN